MTSFVIIFIISGLESKCFRHQYTCI